MSVHTVSDMAAYWDRPEVTALKQAVRDTNPKDKKAYKAALNAVRDKIAELKAM